VKDLLFVPLVAFAIYGASLLVQSYLLPPTIQAEWQPTAQDPIGLGREPRPPDFIPLTKEQRIELIPGFIDGLASENKLYRHWFYMGLVVMTGVRFGAGDQIDDMPKGAAVIQTQYQKWWVEVKKQLATRPKQP
jgi:hypothetical protein